MENDNGVLNPSSSSAAAPDQPQPSSAPRSEPTTSSTLFQELHSYPFNTDPEFKIGLAVILGHPNTPPTEEELRREDDLNLQAKCFYYSRLVYSILFISSLFHTPLYIENGSFTI